MTIKLKVMSAVDLSLTYYFMWMAFSLPGSGIVVSSKCESLRRVIENLRNVELFVLSRHSPTNKKLSHPEVRVQIYLR